MSQPTNRLLYLYPFGKWDSFCNIPKPDAEPRAIASGTEVEHVMTRGDKHLVKTVATALTFIGWVDRDAIGEPE